jgi:type III pantothenate kinase
MPSALIRSLKMPERSLRPASRGKEGMLLTIDIGNTNISMGVFRGRELINHWKISSDRFKTSDEYGILLRNLFQQSGLDRQEVKGIIISSVVPPLTPVFQHLCRHLFQPKPLTVGPGLKTGMPILYENPHEVGADRIVASVSGFERHGGPVVVIDFGTATTFDVVSEKGEYLGGAIAPGIQIAAEALYLKTAKLPNVDIKRPKKAIGRTTEASMQSGLFFGYVGLVRAIIAEIKKELGSEAVVVATGGFARIIIQDIEVINHHEPNLIENGLRILYDRNT